jgi:carbon storage regulator CsrA
MLVLTRKVQESVVVGGADAFQPLLTVTVIAVAGGKVRLGFQADSGVAIHRWEVWQRLQGLGQPGGPSLDPAAPGVG